MERGESVTDEELIDAIRGGDADSLDQLVERHYRNVFQYVCRRTGDSDAAADITQDVFVRIVGLIPGFRNGNFQGYLFTVAHHASMDHFRRRKRTSGRWEPVEDHVDVADSSPDPLEAVERRQADEEADRMLRRLTRRQRDVVELRVLHGLELKEIGRVLGIPLSQVKNRLYASLLRLRKEAIRNED